MEEKNIPKQILSFLSKKFNLDDDHAEHSIVIENINKSVEFKGTNLWILIFAIIVASVGLNVNSTAVIIGAMLISPLMGPIMGLGMALAINDFELLKKSIKNFSFAVAVSILASAIYFYISPLSVAQSELLARTTPTIWDVLIATFGGLAGIVAQTRKDRTTPVIPGVAIATALMPPLCTAGYGIASGNMSYFGGAFYLFFINTVFIALATFAMVRFLKFPRTQIIDPKKSRRIKQIMITVSIATLVPSIIMAYSIVHTSIFENSAQKFVQNVLQFKRSQVVNTKLTFDRKKGSTIEATIIGAPVSDDVIAAAETQLPFYDLEKTKLIVRQATNSEAIDNNSLQKMLTINTDILIEKNQTIAKLEKKIQSQNLEKLPNADMAQEIGALFNNIETVAVSMNPIHATSGMNVGNIIVCVLTIREGKTISEIEQIEIQNWLKIRTKCKKIKLIIHQN